jgi:AmmeMemoRadiSam system protein A/AmmeMemoRadiSam system protein B
MSAVYAYLFPHPPLALPAIGHGEERKINKTLAAMDEAAKEIAAIAPETILFISPHATVYGDYFHISPGEGATGDFARFGFDDIKMAVEYDAQMIAEITSAAEDTGLPAGTEGVSHNLDHGVMVPLWYIRKHYTDFKIVRISPSGQPPQAHYEMGQCIAKAVTALNKPVVLIASGDLSHALADRGPYGYTPEGPQFDEIICETFRTGDFSLLFNKALPLREKAAECGFGPCLMLAGFVHGKGDDSRLLSCEGCGEEDNPRLLSCESHGKDIHSRLLSYEGPFGVGYAVAKVTASAKECPNQTSATSAQNSCPYLTLARHALENRVLGNKPSFLPNLPDELLNRQAGAFVSLHKNGQLRGCIGTIAPTCDNLALEIMQNAVSAGLRDNRFAPVTTAELPHLVYKVDVLAPPEPIQGPGELDVKRYGVIVTGGYRRGLLLPNLDGITSVEQQIAIAKQKAGILPTDPVTLERFEVVRYE